MAESTGTMTVKNAIQGLAVRACYGSIATTDARGVQCDSRLVRPGDLFVAVPGTRDNGLRFVDDACAHGACAIVAAAPPSRSDIPWIELHGAVRPALAQLACVLNGEPSHRLEVYAVTGTNGKTTTVGLLHDMLEAAGRPTGLISTVVTSYPGSSQASTRTTPDACALQGLLRDMADAGCRAVAMEASSHALDQHRIDGTRFQVVGFTNLSQDHLDYHADLEAYFTAKLQLFAMAAAQSGAAAVINTDDPYGVRVAQRAQELGLAVTAYGLSGRQPLRAEEVALAPEGTSFRLCSAAGDVLICTGLSGRYNVMNMLCAAGLALAGGVPLEVVSGVLCAARPRWGRLERVETACASRVFVDYAHTEDALDNVLATLREVTRGKLIVVFGCGGDRDRAKRPKMGRVCAARADCLLITSDNPRSEDPAAIMRDIVAGLPPGTVYETHVDRRAAIARALALAGDDDVVLIAGKGHEAVQVFADRTIPFDDREVIRQLGEDQ